MSTLGNQSQQKTAHVPCGDTDLHSCEGMMSGPCLSSGFETFRVDSYAVSIRSLKSYSDHSYVDLKIMFLSVNKNSIQIKLEGILLVQ